MVTNGLRKIVCLCVSSILTETAFLIRGRTSNQEAQTPRHNGLPWSHIRFLVRSHSASVPQSPWFLILSCLTRCCNKIFHSSGLGSKPLVISFASKAEAWKYGSKILIPPWTIGRITKSQRTLARAFFLASPPYIKLRTIVRALWRTLLAKSAPLAMYHIEARITWLETKMRAAIDNF